MTARTFCSSGHAEQVKAAVHGATTLLLAGMATYNMTAWYFRRDRHLAINAVIYTLFTAWEAEKTRSHLA